MNRPSHWIIATFAILGPVLWVWGFTEGFGTQRETPPAPTGPRQERLEPSDTQASSPFEAKLEGRVVDQLGQPLAGAQIRVLGGSGAALTRTSGSFEVMVKLRDPYRRVEVTASGFSSVVERCSPADLTNFVVQMNAPPPWATQVPLPLSPKRSALAGEGFLLDGDRRPVAGAVVTCLETGDSALTDDVGRFLIPVAAAKVSFVAWHESGTCAEIEASLPAQNEGMVSLGVATLAEGARLGGAILLPDGTPAAQAPVVLRRQGLVRRCLADDGGRFRVHGLVAGDYELEVLPHGGALGIRSPLHVEGPGNLQTELKLVAEQPLRVRVVDDARAPRAGAYVLASDADERHAWAETDVDGRAVLRGLSAVGAVVREARDAALVPMKIEGTLAEAETTTIVTSD
ncbi:MAG: carboxypeptidase-like regulatory domain-containing protein [Planctomycetota bacterium]